MRADPRCLAMVCGLILPVACHKRSADLGPAHPVHGEAAPAARPPPLAVDPFASEPQPILTNSRVLRAIPSRALLLLRLADARATRAQLEQSALLSSIKGQSPITLTAQWVQVLAGQGIVLPHQDQFASLLADALLWNGECAIALVPQRDASPGEIELLFVGALMPELPAAMRTLKQSELPHTVHDGMLYVATSEASLSEAVQRWASGRGSLLALGPYALASQSTGASADLFQAFVNLAQLWRVVQTSFPQGIGDLTRRARLTSYDGLFYAARLVAGDLEELAYLSARERNHPLVALLGAGKLDAELLELLPASLLSVSTLSAGQGDLIERARMLLPADREQALARALGDLSQLLQVNLEGELRACLGAQLAYAVHDGAPVMIASLKDPARLQKLLQRAATDQRLPLLRSSVSRGQTLYAIEHQAAVTLGVDQPPAFAIVGNRLVIAASVDACERLLSGAREAPLTARPDVAEALALASGHIVSFAYQAGADPGASATTRGGFGFIRLEDLCVAITSRGSRFGFRPLLTSAGFDRVLDLALPGIESARVNANEQAAVEMLRRIHTAEREVVAATLIDADHDGVGEYAFLGELTGGAALRASGRPLATPPLKDVLQGVDAASAIACGYCFEVFLPGGRGRPVAAGDPSRVDVDLAERVYRAYAWPLQYGKSGKHAFVMDGEGEIWATENDGKTQAYSGARARPRGDAFGEGEATLLSPGSGPVRQGQDGGVWVAR